MVGVCCGCIAKPASVQPRKTYNTLVGQLFAGTPIATDESIDSSTRRKIQKLQEYVQVNPAKIPKVGASRMQALGQRSNGRRRGFMRATLGMQQQVRNRASCCNRPAADAPRTRHTLPGVAPPDATHQGDAAEAWQQPWSCQGGCARVRVHARARLR